MSTDKGGNEQAIIYKGKAGFKCKPIQVKVKKGSFNALCNILRRENKSSDYMVNQLIGDESARIQPIDEKVAANIMKQLDNGGYEYHTFVSKNEKKKSFLLKGLDEVDTNLIKENLVTAGFPNETKVRRFDTAHQRANPNEIYKKMYQITTPFSFDEKIIKNIVAILSIKVRIEKMKKQPAVQCKRCQGYWHTAAGCHNRYKCVKCATDHGPGECPRNTNNNVSLKCVNCGGPHSANNRRECETYKKKIAPVIEAKAMKSGNSNATGGWKPIVETVKPTRNGSSEKKSTVPASVFNEQQGGKPAWSNLGNDRLCKSNVNIGAFTSSNGQVSGSTFGGTSSVPNGFEIFMLSMSNFMDRTSKVMEVLVNKLNQ